MKQKQNRGLKMFYLSRQSLMNISGVDSRLIEIANLAIKITPIDFGYPRDGGFRSAKTQNELFKNGKSRCDGYDKKSKHQLGLAMDFYAYVNGRANWDKHSLAVVACAHMQAAMDLGYQIQWGGLWKGFADYPHIEIERKIDE